MHWRAATACLTLVLLASCDTTADDADPSVSDSASTLEEPAEDRYRDDTSRAEAMDQIDIGGPSGTPVTWRIDDPPDPVIETVQHAFVLVELAWAEGAEQRPDLVSGLYRSDRTTFTSLFRDRNYVIEGDPDGVLEGPVAVWLREGDDPDPGERLIEACVDLEQASRDGQPVESRALTYRLEQVPDSDATQQWKIRRVVGAPVVSDSRDEVIEVCADWIDD